MSYNRIMVLICIIFLGVAILPWGLFLPYVKSWEIGALELFAKNHLLYGLNITKGIPVFNLIDGKPNYYCSHPPLVPLLLSLSFRLFGINEWSARLVSIIFSIISLFFFYRNYGAYEAGKLVAKLALPEDILYINEISPVSFYAGIESHFFGGRGVKGIREAPEEFVTRALPTFVCIIRYAIEARYDYEKINYVLEKEKYKKIYNKEEVVLWAYRR